MFLDLVLLKMWMRTNTVDTGTMYIIRLEKYTRLKAKHITPEHIYLQVKTDKVQISQLDNKPPPPPI